MESRETPAFLMTTHTAGRAEHNSGHWPSVNTGRPVASNIKYKYLLRNLIFFIYLLGKWSWGTHHEIGVINTLEYNGFRYLNYAEGGSEEVWCTTNWAKDSSKPQIQCFISNTAQWNVKHNQSNWNLINKSDRVLSDWQLPRGTKLRNSRIIVLRMQSECFVTREIPCVWCPN